MEKLYIIGNLTRDPETRIVNTTEGAVTVCSFDVAVNDRNKEKGAKYFRVSAWRKLGDICGKYLRKGAKVAVNGVVTAGAYIDKNGAAQGTLNVNANEVEFLSSSTQSAQGDADDSAYIPQTPTAAQQQFTAVETDELPF